ncbi:hypothetical protein PFY12_10605 [Chryseobacterium camelliae]|uniref:Lipoprotein n=1 Tax=Chryseobacterium camelliae TaxID=1265445 RepID=A0ABY7QIK2_9FLAO|nr:hypothetical protein [Chryseobacterium camelliae]WBV59506.1 hypothetical protein PFY12_10605 [Chryseobacterium camelliae]
MKYYALLFLILFLSCKKQDAIGLPENYVLTEKSISKDCNVFQMRFKEGKYLLKYSLAGSCEGLTAETYIREYISYLEKNYDSLAHKKGYLIFDYYRMKDSMILKDSIVKITERKFNTTVLLAEEHKNTFTLSISDAR